MIRIFFDGIKYIQMQIEDFLGEIVEIVLDLDMEGIAAYRGFFSRSPRFFRRVKRLKTRRLDRAQWRLDNYTGRYIRGLAYLLLRKRKPKGFEGQEVRESQGRGYLKDLFELNDFSYFDNLQRLFGLYTQTGCFTVKDAFKAEIARINEAVPMHRQWLEMLGDFGLRRDIGVEDKRVPSQRQYLRLLAMAGTGLDCFFLQKKAECYAYGLMGSPLKIWDRRFFKVYFTSDPQAGPYMKPSYRGDGYTNSSILDSLWGLPDYFTPYNARMNDQVVFPHTFKAFMRSNGKDFTAILSDGGPDSHGNNRLVLIMVRYRSSMPGRMRWVRW